MHIMAFVVQVVYRHPGVGTIRLARLNSEHLFEAPMRFGYSKGLLETFQRHVQTYIVLFWHSPLAVLTQPRST